MDNIANKNGNMQQQPKVDQQTGGSGFDIKDVFASKIVKKEV